MEKFKALYRCILCGKEFYETIELKYCKIKAVSFGKQILIIDNVLNMNTYDIKNQHNCEDGSIGFANFFRFEKIWYNIRKREGLCLNFQIQNKLHMKKSRKNL